MSEDHVLRPGAPRPPVDVRLSRVMDALAELPVYEADYPISSFAFCPFCGMLSWQTARKLNKGEVPHNRVDLDRPLEPCGSCQDFTTDNNAVSRWFVRLISFHVGPLTDEAVQRQLGRWEGWPEAAPDDRTRGYRK